MLLPGHNVQGSRTFAERLVHRDSKHDGRGLEVGHMVVVSSSRWPPVKVGGTHGGEHAANGRWKCRDVEKLSGAGSFMEEGGWEVGDGGWPP